MSQENVDLVRQALWDGVDVVPLIRDEAASTRFLAEMETIFAGDCAFAWIMLGQRVEATGLDEARQVWLNFYAPWESLRSEVDRIIPVGDKVVALMRQHGRMAGSQHEVEALFAAVYLVRDGKVVRAEFYPDRAEALDAVGLRE